ncbi:hypothetical protein [Streptomyces sp. NPDC002537]
MWLRKTRQLPGSAPGGYAWSTHEDVVEVPDGLATDLLAIPDAGFTEAAAPSGPATASAPETGDAQAAKRRPGRPRAAISE